MREGQGQGQGPIGGGGGGQRALHRDLSCQSTSLPCVLLVVKSSFRAQQEGPSARQIAGKRDTGAVTPTAAMKPQYAQTTMCVLGILLSCWVFSTDLQCSRWPCTVEEDLHQLVSANGAHSISQVGWVSTANSKNRGA